MSSIPLFWWFVLLLFVAWAGALGIGLRRVPQGYEYLVERRGRYLRTLGAGTHLLVPGIDRVGAMQDIRESQLAIKHLVVVTRDHVNVDVALTCFAQIVDSAKANYEIKGVRSALEELVSTEVSNVLAACPLAQLVSDRERLLRELPERLDRATDAWGVKITRLDIRDVRPPAVLLDSILEERRAEHAQRAALLAAETERTQALEVADRARLLAQATVDAQLAAAAINAKAVEQQARLEHETLLAQRAREHELQAAEQQRAHADVIAEGQREIERETLARLQRQQAAEQARAVHEQAMVAEQERAALAWRQELERVEREREAAQMRHEVEQAEEAHQTQLAVMAAEREREARRIHDLAETERASQMQQTVLADAQTAHEQALRAPMRREELARVEQARLRAEIEQQRELEQARFAALREKQEVELETARRAAELIHQEATLRAQAREMVAEADARAVQKLAAALSNASPQAVTYLAAREHADALRSLGQSNARVVVVPGSAPTNLDALARMTAEPTERE